MIAAYLTCLTLSSDVCINYLLFLRFIGLELPALMAETQSLKDELEQEKGQSSKLSVAIKKLEEKVALFESKVSQLEHELSNVWDELINARKDLNAQKFTFKQHLEAKTHHL